MNERQKTIIFFRDNAGYCTPPGRMACAKSLADAETMAEDLELEVKWCDELESPVDVFGDSEDTRDTLRRLDNGSTEMFYAYILNDTGGCLASLGMIEINVDDQDYRRVVEAELFSEAISELKKGA